MHTTISEVLAESLEQMDRTAPLAAALAPIGAAYGGYMILLGLAIRRGVVSDTAILEAVSREYGRSGAKSASDMLEKCIEVAAKFDIQEEKSK